MTPHRVILVAICVTKIAILGFLHRAHIAIRVCIRSFQKEIIWHHDICLLDVAIVDALRSGDWHWARNYILIIPLR